jgi:hypothetical protein
MKIEDRKCAALERQIQSGARLTNGYGNLLATRVKETGINIKLIILANVVAAGDKACCHPQRLLVVYFNKYR